MKLYYSAGSCSTSCHISLEESGLKYETVAVDFDNTSDPNIALVTKLNPLGTLPIFITDEGKQLDQNLSIHTYVANKAPGKKLLPTAGTQEYFEAMNMLSFVATDLHKAVGALFGVSVVSEEKNIQEAVRKFLMTRATATLSYLDSKLAGKDYILGKDFTVVDAYAYVVTGWTKWLEVPLTPYKNIQGYMTRVTAALQLLKF